MVAWWAAWLYRGGKAVQVRLALLRNVLLGRPIVSHATIHGTVILSGRSPAVCWSRLSAAPAPQPAGVGPVVLHLATAGRAFVHAATVDGGGVANVTAVFIDPRGLR